MNNLLPNSGPLIHDWPVRALYLDLASHDGLLAFSDGTSVLGAEACDHKIGDHELLPLIQSVLQKAGCALTDLTHIACVSGPGGFTSLRVAVTCANVLADQLGIPAADVHLSSVWATKVRSQPPAASKFLWLHSTKKEELFARTFGDNTWPEPVHLSLAQFQVQAPSYLSWCGELIEEHQAIAHKLGLQEIEKSNRQPETWLPGLLASLPYKKQLLLPWYGRGY